jgi:hypothetical protein
MNYFPSELVFKILISMTPQVHPIMSILPKTFNLARITIFIIAYTAIAYAIPLQGTPTPTYLLGAAVTGLLYAILLNYVGSKLRISRLRRILTFAAPIFATQFFNPLLEGFFFTARIGPTEAIGGSVFGLLLALIYSGLTQVLFPPQATAVSDVGTGSIGLMKVHRLKLLLAALSWPLIYFVFGFIASPIVTPYYSDPQSPYYLVLPSLGTVFILQTIRGFIYLASLLPIAYGLRLDLSKMLLVFTGFMYIVGGLAIFVIIETFPLALRIVHGLEIFVDSLAFSAAVTYALRNRTFINQYS